MKIKVVFCTRGIFPLSIGGIQRHSRLLIEELAKRRNIDITVIHPHEGKVFEVYPDIKEISVPKINPSKNYLLELYGYSKSVAQVLSKPDFSDHLVYAQGFTVWKDIKQYKDRLIYNPHGLEPFQTLSSIDWQKLTPYRILSRHIFRNSKAVISLGGRLTGILEKNIPKKSSTSIVTIPNATNILVDKFGLIQNEAIHRPINCLFVGRFAENKGIRFLLEAVKILNHTGHAEDFHFILGGKGPLFQKLSTEYKKYENIEFKGFVSDEELRLFYQNSDIFILPTLFEGMPTVVLEAMSYKLPIIVTDVGATRELVDDKNGFIIEKESPDSIVESLIKFKSLPLNERKALGNFSFDKVRNKFSWNKVAKDHEVLFKKMYENINSD